VRGYRRLTRDSRPFPQGRKHARPQRWSSTSSLSLSVSLSRAGRASRFPFGPARTRFESAYDLRENPARNHQHDGRIRRCAPVTVSYARALRVSVRVHACCKRGVPHAEYRDRLSRMNATRAAAASGLWTGWQQSTGSVLYLRISHSLGGRASALVLARSLARSLAPCAARRFCTRAISPRLGGSIFSSSLNLRAHADDASLLHAWSRGCCDRIAYKDERCEGKGSRGRIESIERSIAFLAARQGASDIRGSARILPRHLGVAERGKVRSSYLDFRLGF